MVRKVAVTGPESTGKSMLARQLADHYQTIWVPEYARSYLGMLGRPYNEDDILAIAKGQVALEAKMFPDANQLLFSDTELLVTKIWSEIKYKRCHPWIDSGFNHQQYDLYLLCDVDLPWEYDPQREHPEMREILFEMYRKALILREVQFEVVSGLGDARLQHAVQLIETKKSGWYE